MYIFSKLFLVLAMSLVGQEIFADELVQIMSVSESGKSFVIRRGRTDGMSVGQEAVFATDKLALMATAIEVGRDFSLWQLSNKNAVTPFVRQEMVIFHSSEESIWNMETSAEREKRLLEIKEVIRKERGIIKSDIHWLARVSLAKGLFESNNLDSGGRFKRQGAGIEVLYSNMLSPIFEWGIGGRIDRDYVELDRPSIDYVNTRTMAISEVSYHFSPIHNTNSNGFISIGAGFGLSRTDIDSTSSKGTTLSLPYLRTGMQWFRQKNYAWVMEFAAERLTSIERFNGGSNVEESFYNFKVSLGIKF